MAFEATKLPHESSDIRIRTVLILVFGFIGCVAVLTIALGMFYRFNVKSGSIESALRDFPAPQLQPNPGQDYVTFRKAQRDQLSGTRWVDEGKTLIHVPIERAMRFVAGRGTSAYDPLAAGADTTLPPTPQDGAVRLRPSNAVAPYGVHP